MTEFETGYYDAKNDLADGWVPENYSLDYVLNQLRVMMGASDSYCAGYLSVLFGSK
jgi:hypothetical protein